MIANHKSFYGLCAGGGTSVRTANMLIAFVVMALFAPLSTAAARITAEQVRQVMEAADLASVQKDASAVGDCLGENFAKYIDVPVEPEPVIALIDKHQYLALIEEGWNRISDYTYTRKDVVIHVATDGSSAETYSTIIETFTVDGRSMVSKIREYARYAMEGDRPVIVNVESHKLVGDTTPE
jgi:hypothetical protein